MNGRDGRAGLRHGGHVHKVQGVRVKAHPVFHHAGVHHHGRRGYLVLHSAQRRRHGLKHAAVGRHVHGRTSAVHVASGSVPARGKGGKHVVPALVEHRRPAGLRTVIHEIHAGIRLAFFSETHGRVEILPREHRMDDVPARRAALPRLRRALHGRGDVVAVAPPVHDLPRRHEKAAIEGIHLAAAVDVEHILSGPHEVEMHAVLIGRFHQKRRAEGAEVGIQTMQDVVAVAAVEHLTHGLGCLVEPCPHAGNMRLIGSGKSQPKPRPHRAGHAALHSRGKRAHGEHARGVHQPAVELRLFVVGLVRIRSPPRGQKKLRKRRPCRIPAATLRLQLLVPALQFSYVHRHGSTRRAWCCRTPFRSDRRSRFCSS